MSDTDEDEKSLRRFYARHQRIIRELARTTHFNDEQLRSVIIIYTKLLAENGPNAPHISRTQFREFLQCTIKIAEGQMIDRCMAVLDRGKTPKVTLEKWIRALSLFLFGTLKEQCRYCFSVYNESGDGFLNRDQLLKQLRPTVIKDTIDETDEMCKDIADQLVKRLDWDTDGAISFDDYYESVLHRPPLLQMLGKCLPERLDVVTFLSTFTADFTPLCTL